MINTDCRIQNKAIAGQELPACPGPGGSTGWRRKRSGVWSFQVCVHHLARPLYKPRPAREPAREHPSGQLPSLGAGAASATARPLSSSLFPAARSSRPALDSASMGLFCALLLLLTAGQADTRGHHHHHCFSQAQLQAGEPPARFVSRTMHWDRYAPVQLVPHLEKLQREEGQRRKRQLDGCPALQLQAALDSEPNERSLSPWRYSINEDENRYPQKLAFAECLCRGCIDVKTGRETSSLNSVPMHQTMMVLRRKPCPHHTSPGTFTFEVDYIKVPVGCTCVLPRSSG